MSHPNILWIVTTQWRAQACGYAGDPNARTPTLDRLAETSVNFSQAVTPHPFGPFARGALLTGKRCPENGLVDYFDPLPPESPTIAHQLRTRNYETGFFGKWHLWKRNPHAPLVGEPHAKIIVPPHARGGFDFWEGFESGFLLNNPWLHGTRLPEPTPFSGYQAEILCTRAAQWLQERPRLQPWFCCVSLESPHPPYDAPANGITPPDPATLRLRANVPAGGDTEAKARRELSGYYAHLAATDRAIGQLLTNVDATTTLVVFTSVHGDMHGSHGHFRKGWPHEESIRVPLLIRAPLLAPQASDAAVSLVDLPAMMTTYIDHGRFWSTPPAEAQISMPSVVPFANQCDRIWSGTRTPERKRISDSKGEPWLDFDLLGDPYEQHNRIGPRPA